MKGAKKVGSALNDVLKLIGSSVLVVMGLFFVLFGAAGRGSLHNAKLFGDRQLSDLKNDFIAYADAPPSCIGGDGVVSGDGGGDSGGGACGCSCSCGCDGADCDA